MLEATLVKPSVESLVSASTNSQVSHLNPLVKLPANVLYSIYSGTYWLISALPSAIIHKTTTSYKHKLKKRYKAVCEQFNVSLLEKQKRGQICNLMKKLAHEKKQKMEQGAYRSTLTYAEYRISKANYIAANIHYSELERACVQLARELFDQHLLSADDMFFERIAKCYEQKIES